MKDCIFCKIINNEIKSYKVYEDDIVLAFLDLFPKSMGHTLIVPKKHVTDLNDIDMKTLNHIFEKAKILQKTIYEKLEADGLVLMQNNGSAQEVKHFHLHLIPEYKNKQKNIALEEIHTILT